VGPADNELLQSLREAENVRINQEILIEREWWGLKVLINEDDALANGLLVIVPDEGRFFRLIGRLRHREEPKTLNPLAYQLLLEIQEQWIKIMNKSGEAIEDVYLSIISLYRSQEFQMRIMHDTYLASNGISAHCAGAAIDFDPNGYYLGLNRKSIQSGSTDFRSIYTLVLKQILEKLVSEGACHVIWEKGIKIEGDVVIRYKACYHICVSPSYKPNENFNTG